MLLSQCFIKGGEGGLVGLPLLRPLDILGGIFHVERPLDLVGARTTILVDPAAPKDRMEHSSDMMSTLYQHSPPLRHQPMFSKLPDMYFCRYR